MSIIVYAQEKRNPSNIVREAELPTLQLAVVHFLDMENDGIWDNDFKPIGWDNQRQCAHDLANKGKLIAWSPPLVML